MDLRPNNDVEPRCSEYTGPAGYIAYLHIIGFQMYTENDNTAGVGGCDFGGTGLDENSRSAGYLVGGG